MSSDDVPSTMGLGARSGTMNALRTGAHLAVPTDGMKRSVSTMVHRTKRGNSVTSRTVQVDPSAASSGAASLAASMNSTSPGTTSLFDQGNPLGAETEVQEEGTSDDEEEEAVVVPLQTRKKSIGGGALGQPPPTPEDTQQEIERAVNGRKCVDLSNIGLTALPDRIQPLTHIVELLLEDNLLHDLDQPYWRHFTSLEKLSLKANKSLKTIPIILFQMPSLETLLLDQCPIQHLPIDSADGEAAMNAPNLKTFGAEGCRLQHFPTALLRKCPLLEALWLADNEDLHELPSVDFLQSINHPLKMKIDNRPRLMGVLVPLQEQKTLNPNITLDWHKIYPDKVLDYLYLGSVRTAQCVQVYKDLDIGYVLTAGRGLQVKLAEGMEQLELGIDDLPGEDMKPFFSQAFEFINKAREAKKGILIHCFAGLSRSVTFTCAYLMHIMYPMTRDEALRLVKESRPSAQPNEGFMKGLLQWEEMLRRERGNGTNDISS